MGRFIRRPTHYRTIIHIPAPDPDEVDCREYRKMVENSTKWACVCPFLSKKHKFKMVILDDLTSASHFFKICPKLTQKQRMEYEQKFSKRKPVRGPAGGEQAEG
jgi:hypothetical protein